MRSRIDIFLERLSAYMKECFDRECTALGIDSVKNYQIGYVNEPLSATTEYPASLMTVSRKTATDCYTSLYSCSVAVAVTADDMATLGKLGLIWSDILEDAIRSDYHLGGACLDVNDDFDVLTSYADDLMIIVAEFEAEIDLGGYVYADEGKEGKAVEGMQEVWLLNGKPDEDTVS